MHNPADLRAECSVCCRQDAALPPAHLRGADHGDVPAANLFQPQRGPWPWGRRGRGRLGEREEIMYRLVVDLGWEGGRAKGYCAMVLCERKRPTRIANGILPSQYLQQRQSAATTTTVQAAPASPRTPTLQSARPRRQTPARAAA